MKSPVRFPAEESFRSFSEAVRLITEAHRLIDEFQARQMECPERAWESVVQLQELLRQFQLLRPAPAFRKKQNKGKSDG
jgi:hypothetical protein